MPKLTLRVTFKIQKLIIIYYITMYNDTDAIQMIYGLIVCPNYLIVGIYNKISNYE